jgi:hypothetical protein
MSAAPPVRRNNATRLVVLWERSRHASPEEFELWAWQRFAPLRQSELVGRVELAHLRPPIDRFHAWLEWMVEFDVGCAADASALVEEGPLREVLAELRSLKLRPVVLTAEGVYRVGGWWHPSRSGPAR